MTTDHLLTCVSLVITGFFVYGTFRIDAKLSKIDESSFNQEKYLAEIRDIIAELRRNG